MTRNRGLTARLESMPITPLMRAAISDQAKALGVTEADLRRRILAEALGVPADDRAEVAA